MSKSSKSKNPSKQAVSWRDVLPIHPAAELFPMMTPDELRELGEDIRKNGLTSPVVLWRADDKAPMTLLDGRNRLYAIGSAAEDWNNINIRKLIDGRKVIVLDSSVDPYAFVISANIHRRHLTVEQRRELIAKLIKATPEKSDRQIAEQTKASPTTVGKVRRQLEDIGEVSKLDTRTDKRGVKQQAHKDPAVTAAVERAVARSEANKRRQVGGNAVDPAASAEQRKAEAAEDNEARQAKTPGEMLFSLLTAARDLLPAHSADEIRALVATIPQHQVADWTDAAEWLIRLGGRLKLDLERRAEINDPPAGAPTRAAPPVELPEIPPFLDRRAQAAPATTEPSEPTKH